MISCLACDISRRTSVSISCLSVSKSATVTDGDVASVGCVCDDVAAIDELCKLKPSDSWPVSDWNLLLTMHNKYTLTELQQQTMSVPEYCNTYFIYVGKYKDAAQ